MKVVSKILNVLSLTFSICVQGVLELSPNVQIHWKTLVVPVKKKSLFTENSNNPALWCLKTANERYFCELILLLSG